MQAAMADQAVAALEQLAALIMQVVQQHQVRAVMAELDLVAAQVSSPAAAVAVQQLRDQMQQAVQAVQAVMVLHLILLGAVQPQQVKIYQELTGMQAAAVVVATLLAEVPAMAVERAVQKVLLVPVQPTQAVVVVVLTNKMEAQAVRELL
jgi:hypothetical protein